MITDEFRPFVFEFVISASVNGESVNKLQDMLDMPVRLSKVTPLTTHSNMMPCELVFTANVDSAEVVPAQRSEYENCIELLTKEIERLHTELLQFQIAANNVHIARAAE